MYALARPLKHCSLLPHHHPSFPTREEERGGTEGENQVGTAGDWGDTPHCDVMHVLRGLPYMTSAQRGRGVEKYLKLADKQYIKFEQKGWGSKNPKLLRTSYMEAPLRHFHI